MKRTNFYFIILSLVIISLAINAEAKVKAVKWDLFSKNLVLALKTDNDGLKRSAMMRIIQYADSLKVDEAAFDIMWIYRHHKDEKCRQLALVTLYKMQNRWAINALKLHVKFEKSPQLRNQIYAILNDYQNRSQQKNKM